MTIDLKAIRSDAVASEKIGITCEVNPSTILELLDRLEAAEKDAARKVIRVKLGDQYGNDLNGHWFYLQPADEEAQKVLDNRSLKS